MTLWTGHSSSPGLAPGSHPARTDPRLASAPLLTESLSSQPTSAVRPWLRPPAVKAASKLVKAGTSSLSQNKNIFLPQPLWWVSQCTAISTQFDQFRLSSTNFDRKIFSAPSPARISLMQPQCQMPDARFSRFPRVTPGQFVLIGVHSWFPLPHPKLNKTVRKGRGV